MWHMWLTVSMYVLTDYPYFSKGENAELYNCKKFIWLTTAPILMTYVCPMVCPLYAHHF